MEYKFGSKHDAGTLLGTHPGSITRYRKNQAIGWIEGVHYTKVTYQNIRYNLTLLEDWMINRHDPAAHQRAIEAYQASRPSNQPKRKKSGAA